MKKNKNRMNQKQWRRLKQKNAQRKSARKSKKVTMKIGGMEIEAIEQMVPVEELAAMPVFPFKPVCETDEDEKYALENVWTNVRAVLSEKRIALVGDIDTTELFKSHGTEPFAEAYDAYAKEPDSTMISQDDFIPHDCIFCGIKITSVHHSHNPFPLLGRHQMDLTAKRENGKTSPRRCCPSCEKTIVRENRMHQVVEAQKSSEGCTGGN